MNKKEFMTLRIVAFIAMLILFKVSTMDISYLQKYLVDFCIMLLSVIWTLTEIFNYEGWKP